MPIDRMTRILSIWLVAGILALASAPPVHAVDKLTLGGAEHEVTMVNLEVLKVAYAKLGLPIEIRPMPAGRSLAEADLGRTDGEVIRIAAIEHQHPDLIRIPVPVNLFEGLAFTCNKTLRITDLESISNLRVGIRTGIRFMERATLGMPHVTTLMDFNLLFDLLCQDRLDVVIATGPTGYLQMKRFRPGTITDHRPPLITMELFHYLHRKREALVPDITATLEAMQKSGEIERIRKQASIDYRKRLLEPSGNPMLQ